MKESEALRWTQIENWQVEARQRLGVLRFIPILVDLLSATILKQRWKEIDRLLARRAKFQWDGVSAAQTRALEQFTLSSTTTVGWTDPHFCATDHIGVLLWDPQDFLAGVEVLIELEQVYELSAGSLEWEMWHSRPLSALIDYLATHEPNGRTT